MAPSVDDNNRYLKLTPLGDRVRVAYTVFFGEVPGATERRTIDANRDGQISEAEGHAFGLRIAAEVAVGLELEVDGKVEPVTWAVVDVGLGTPEVGAGAFSVDMVAYACFTEPRGRHHVVARDRFRIPRPGETEARVEDSPGVKILNAHVGTANDPSHDFRFAGPGGPLADDGLDVTFDAGPGAAVTPDGVCAQRAHTGGGTTRAWWIVVAALAIALAALGGWQLRRRARARARA